MRNLFLVTFAWLMMIAIIGSVIYSMMFITLMYARNEGLQFLSNCFTGVLLIPAYKGLSYIHSLWAKSLKEYREYSLEDRNPVEVPFFKEPALKGQVAVNEHPFVNYKVPQKGHEEYQYVDVNREMEKILSSAEEKLSKMKSEEKAAVKNDNHLTEKQVKAKRGTQAETPSEKEEKASPKQKAAKKTKDKQTTSQKRTNKNTHPHKDTTPKKKKQ
jgi:hypothetical protein